MSIGALGDSFYEYLLKAWIQTAGEDTQAKEMYSEAIKVSRKLFLNHNQPVACVMCNSILCNVFLHILCDCFRTLCTICYKPLRRVLNILASTRTVE